jgi:predicted nucleic acid-binding protein
MTAFALDTNIISHLMREHPLVVSHIRDVLASQGKLVIPPLVYYEVRRGLLSKKMPVRTAAFDRLCQQIPVGAVTRASLDIAAQIYASLHSQRCPIDDADLLIAAFCLDGGYTLVTDNLRHFERVAGLQTANWTV